MTTIGFAEAFKYSLSVCLINDPPLDVRICTPPAMVMLKLIAWDEKYPEREKDAQDIEFIASHYIDAGNDSRLDEEDTDLREEEHFDYEMASARILGRDIAKIAGAETLSLLLTILERETKEDSNFRLVTDMNRNSNLFEERFEQNRSILLQLKLGRTDRQENSLNV